MDTPSRKSTSEQEVPHSGNLGLEQPINTFDKTPLPVAFEKHLTDEKGNINIPEPHKALNTAEQDIIPTPLVSEKEKKPMSRGKKIGLAVIGGIAATGIAIPTILGITSQGNTDENNEPPVKNPNETSQTEETNEKPPVVEEKTPEELEAERILNLPKPERFDELDGMTIEQFNQQPIEARVEYGAWLNRDNKNLAENWFEATENPRDQLVINTVVSSENTGQEIYENTTSILRGALTAHFIESESGDEPLFYDNLQREKMISSLYLYPAHPIAEEWRIAVSEKNISGYFPDFYSQKDMLIADDEVTYRSENYTLTDQAGVERTAVDITWRDPEGVEATATHILIQTATTSQWVVAE